MNIIIKYASYSGLCSFYFNVELPVITVAPEDTTVNEGSSFSLTCNYTGVPSPSATWYKDNVQLVSVPGKIEVLTNQISVYSSEEENEGTYKCSIENEAGTAEAEATVDVIREFNFC